MGIIFLLFFLGIMFIIVGYTHQKTPSCDKGLRMKLVNRDNFSKISGLYASHFGSEIKDL